MATQAEARHARFIEAGEVAKQHADFIRGIVEKALEENTISQPERDFLIVDIEHALIDMQEGQEYEIDHPELDEI